MDDNTTETVQPGMNGLDNWETAFLAMQAIIFIPTVFGNMLVIVSIYKFTWLQTPLNYLVGSLAFSDLLMGLLLMPLDVFGTLLGFNSYENVCLVQLTTMLALVLSSLLSMVAISMERCFSVTFPYKHRAMKRQPYVTVFIVLCWLFSVTFSSLPMLGLDTFTTQGKCKYITVWPKHFRFAVNTFIIAMVFTKIVFFAVTVRVALKRAHRYTADNDGAVLRRRMAKTYVLIIISAMFIVCWAPYCVISWTRTFLPDDDGNVTAMQGWALIFAFFNAALNWLVYGLKNEHFRKAFGILLCRRNIINIDERPSSS